ncbi:MAG: hypothetical protein ABFC28_00770 [Rikenellaceae bacterium]
MEILTFTIAPALFDQIVTGKCKTFRTSIKPSEIQEYFYLTASKSIDIKDFNIVEFKTLADDGTERTCQFKTGNEEIDFLIPNDLLDVKSIDLNTFYDSEHMPAAEIEFELRELLY